MSRWHRENPEYLEMYGEPDWLGHADNVRKRQKEEPDPRWCVVCGEFPAGTGGPTRCLRCARSLEEERIDRD
jgi:hypothetical protein